MQLLGFSLIKRIRHGIKFGVKSLLPRYGGDKTNAFTYRYLLYLFKCSEEWKKCALIFTHVTAVQLFFQRFLPLIHVFHKYSDCICSKGQKYRIINVMAAEHLVPCASVIIGQEWDLQFLMTLKATAITMLSICFGGTAARLHWHCWGQL